MTITYTPTTCFLGKALAVSNGYIEFIITLDVGPRVISLRVAGGENIMFEDKADAVKKDVSSVYGEGETWHIYGGHRLWLAPEELNTYYPDNEKCEYAATEKGVEISSYRRKNHNLKISLKIEFLSKNEMEILHKISNFGEKTEGYLWGLTALKSGGELTVPLPKNDTGYLPNRNLVLWPYSDAKDKRLRIDNDKIVIKSDNFAEKPLKIGAHIGNSPVAYSLKQENGTVIVFQKTTTEKSGNNNYPDMGCNFETYCSNLIHEVEFLSPHISLKNGENAAFSEVWNVREQPTYLG